MMVGGSRGTGSKRGACRGAPVGDHQTGGPAGGHRAKRAGSAALRRPGDRRCAVAVPDHAKRADVPAATLLPARRPAGREAARTARVDGAPDDDVGGHVGRHPRRRRRRNPAQGRRRPVGHRFRIARQGRRRHAAQPGRPRRRAERSHRHRQGGHRPRRASGRLLPGRHVRLPDRGIPPVQGPRQHHRVRSTGRHAGRVADEPARRAGCRGGRFHGRPRLFPHRYPRLVGTRRVPDARPDQDRPVARWTSCANCTTATHCCPANSSGASSRRRAGSRGPARRSPSCSNSSSRTTG